MRNNDNCGCGLISTSTTKCKTVVATQPHPGSGYRPHISNGCSGPIKPILSPMTTTPSHPTVTIENLLSLIEHKCDRVTCDTVQHEIDHIYDLLNLLKPTTQPDPDKDKKPGITNGVVSVTPVPTISPIAFQLIADMTESLQGDITSKYPSATLLKTELMKLWKCLYNKQQHHGTWDTNFVMRDLAHPEDEECLIDGDPSSLGNQLKVIVPVDVGSTVFHTIEGKQCLFESLVDNNVTEPSKMAVLDGLWLNYCDIRDVIDCVLPRQKLVDCTQNCLDTNGDGVVEGPTLCEKVEVLSDSAVSDALRLNCIEAQICNTDCDPALPTICERIAHLEEAASLPSGAQTFVSAIYGTFNVVHDGTGISSGTPGKESSMLYEFEAHSHTFSPAQYKYLSKAGRNLIISGNASIAYKLEVADKLPGCGMQWDTRVYIDGVIVKNVVDMYCCNRSGHNAGGADNFSFSVKTTGNPIVVKFVYCMAVGLTNAAGILSSTAIGDMMQVDKGSATITFTGEEIV